MESKPKVALMFVVLILVFASSILAQVNKEDRLKNQPEILIRTDIEKIRSVIIKRMTDFKYSIDKDETHQLVFRKETKGASGVLSGMVLSGGKNPYQIITFVITKQDGGVLVAEKAAILYPDSRGEGRPRDVDTKQVRKELWNSLDEIKAKSEQ